MLLVTHKYWDASLHLQHLTALHEGWSPLAMHFRELSNAQIGSVATAAGIGGGASFVPLFNILLNFSRLLTSTRVIPFLCCSSVDSQMLCPCTGCCFQGHIRHILGCRKKETCCVARSKGRDSAFSGGDCWRRRCWGGGHAAPEAPP